MTPAEQAERALLRRLVEAHYDDADPAALLYALAAARAVLDRVKEEA